MVADGKHTLISKVITMKTKTLMFAVIFTTALFLAATCWALVPDTVPGIILVDADGPSEVTLNIVQADVLPIFGHNTLGRMEGGVFEAFDYSEPYSLIQFSDTGGTVVDFAMEDVFGNVHSLSAGDGSVTFLGTPIKKSDLPVGTLVNPNWITKWYNSFLINWHWLKSDFITSFEVGIVDSGQGYSGVAAVPIPTTIWIFGSGLVGLVGIRKMFKT